MYALSVSRKHYKSRNMAEETTLSDLEVVKLTPEDIPGALHIVESESEVGKWTIDKLKFWLKCRRLDFPEFLMKRLSLQ